MTYYIQISIVIALIFLSILALSIVIDRFIFLREYSFKEDLVQMIKKTLANNDLAEIKKICELNSTNPLLNLIELIIDMKSSAKQAIEKKLERDLQLKYNQMEKRLAILNTITSISPLLGLLGTVIGMIDAFWGLTIGNNGANVIASGISNALITTALGLGVAIPSIVFYNFFIRKINLIISFLERQTLEALEMIKIE